MGRDLGGAVREAMNLARRELAAPSRNPRMAVVVGRLLGAAFLTCFLTGLLSHFLQQPLPWMHFPAWPGLYAVTQGVHITVGIACFPLLLGKLYAVYPNLFQTPPVKSIGHFLERASIAVFVAASIIQIVTGLINTYQWYPWPFPFKQVHFALSFVIIGSLAIHIACKLPVIAQHWSKKADAALAAHPEPPSPARSGLGSPSVPPGSAPSTHPRPAGVTGRVLDWIDGVSAEERTQPQRPAISRRGFLTTIGVSAGALVLLTAGQSFAFLDATNVFGVRKQGIGPNNLPVNRSAKAAQVLESAVAPDWQLTLRRGEQAASFDHAALAALPQREVQLPIACVEGWSQQASWRGVRLRDLMASVGWKPGESLRFTSLEKKGGYRTTTMGPEYVQDPTTLIALEVNGAVLDVEHGFPARVIAPGRPGVLQTKWLSSIEVLS